MSFSSSIVQTSTCQVKCLANRAEPVRCMVIFGGSFNPVHNAHIAIVRAYINLLLPDEVRVIPVGNPWQKAVIQTSPEHRFNMVWLAFSSLHPHVVVDTREIFSVPPNYTIDTLLALRTEVGQACSLVFILGEDQLANLPTWKDWQNLWHVANIGVISRATPFKLPRQLSQVMAHRLTDQIELLRMTPCGLLYYLKDFSMDISSTQIRMAFEHKNAVSLHWLKTVLPVSVLNYIHQHGLYTIGPSSKLL